MLELAPGLRLGGAEAPKRFSDLGRCPGCRRRLCAGDLRPQNTDGRLDRAWCLATGRHFFSRSCRFLSRCFPGHAFPMRAPSAASAECPISRPTISVTLVRLIRTSFMRIITFVSLAAFSFLTSPALGCKVSDGRRQRIPKDRRELDDAQRSTAPI